MTKKDLVDRIAADVGIKKHQAEKAIDALTAAFRNSTTPFTTKQSSSPTVAGCVCIARKST